jgi:type I restriction enzyme S subunit
MSKEVARVLAAQEPSARYLVGNAAQGEANLTRAFDLLATAQGGVAWLRELIKALAIRGLLVSQDMADESASLLIQRVLLDKAKQIVAGTIQVGKPQPDVEDDECFCSVPSNWQWVRFGALVLSSEAGWSPSCDAGPRQRDAWGVLKVSAVSWGEFDPHENKQLPASLTPRPEYEVKDGDFLLSRANTAELVARSVVVRDATPKLMLSDKIIRINLSPLVDRRFFNMVNNGRWARNYYVANASGTSSSMKNVGRAVILHMPVPLPPLAEQHRIVTRVEELMRLCDALAAKGQLADAQHARLVSTLFDALTRSQSPQELAEHWQRISAHFDLLLDRPEAIDALEQTILQLAVRGLLVPQDPSDEPASELLARIRVEKDKLIADGKVKRQRCLPSVDLEGVPFDLPPGWAWARFPELGEFGRGKSKHRPRNDPALFNPGIYPLIQTGEVARSSGVIHEIHSHYSEVGLAQSKLWPAGTMCITIAANIADAALLGFDACFPDSVVGFVPSPLIKSTEYFLYFMRTARERLIEFAPATAQKNINLEILESVLIPVPPTREVERIVTRVQQLRALCAQLRERLHTARATQSRLAQTLVDQAAQA